MTRNRILTGICILPLALNLSSAVAATDEDPLDADIFIELNDTDGDLSLQGSVDAAPYRRLSIKGPAGRVIMALAGHGSLGRHGLGELDFEGDSTDERPTSTPAEFFTRHPEGAYTVSITTLRGAELTSTTDFTHVLPAAPAMKVGGKAPKSCASRLAITAEPVVISWDPVTTSHPTIGTSGPVNIVEYKVIVEDQSAEEGGDFEVGLPASVTQFEIPAEFTGLGRRFKVELAAVADTENTTTVEACFKVGS